MIYQSGVRGLRIWFAGLFLALVMGIGLYLALLSKGQQEAFASYAPYTPSTSSTQATARVASENDAGVQTAPSSCSLDWHVVPSPNRTPGSNTLNSVAALSANDIWAVGQTFSGTTTTLAEHWDGQQWTIVPSPDAASQYSELSDVTAISTNDMWAVGEAALLIHWDGSTWTQVTLPASLQGSLYAIEAVSANDMWVAGEIYDPEESMLMLHWDGSTWTRFPAPAGGDMWNHIQSVRALSANDVWAVGYYRNTGYPEQTYVLHWDGSTWSLVPSTINGSVWNDLYAVAPISANDVWAVGKYSTSESGAATLIIHWDGTSLSIVPSPNPSIYGEYLFGITAVSASDIWAVGKYLGGDSSTHTLILHWDGTVWAQASYTDTGASLFGVDALSSTNIWAVGAIGSSTHIEQYAADCPLPTFTPASTDTSTPVPPTPTYILTSTPADTATPEPPRCPGERFTDVCPGDYFYQPVLSLNDGGIVSGYNTTPPCDSALHIPCFKPYNNVTRGQVAKIISLAAGFTEPVSGQTFEDVPTDHTFYEVIERMASRNIINGYPCGGPGEPCVQPDNRPYFRPANSVTRGQLTKMDSLAFSFTEPVSGQTFEDVWIGSTYYEYIERISARGIINGYPCGGTGEPCGPENRPYFRPGNPITRGQTAKIVYLSMQP